MLDAFIDDEVGLVNIARRNNQLGLGKMVANLDEGLVYRTVLAPMGTAGNHDGTAFIKAQFMKKTLLFFFRYDAVGLIVLGVARDDDLIGIGADIDDVLGIDIALHAEHANRRQDAARKEGNQAVANGTALTDAAVHHHDRNVFISGNAQKVRPDFRFDQDDSLGIDDGQDAVGKIRQIQRKVEDTVGPFNDLMGHAESRRRNDRHDDDFIGVIFSHFTHNGAGRDDFTDRGGVDPNSMTVRYFFF